MESGAVDCVSAQAKSIHKKRFSPPPLSLSLSLCLLFPSFPLVCAACVAAIWAQLRCACRILIAHWHKRSRASEARRLCQVPSPGVPDPIAKHSTYRMFRVWRSPISPTRSHCDARGLAVNHRRSLTCPYVHDPDLACENRMAPPFKGTRHGSQRPGCKMRSPILADSPGVPRAADSHELLTKSRRGPRLPCSCPALFQNSKTQPHSRRHTAPNTVFCKAPGPKSAHAKYQVAFSWFDYSWNTGNA